MMAQKDGEHERSELYRVGVIGCGNTSKFFLTGWESVTDRARVVALCDICPDQIERRKEDYPELCGSASAYTDYRAMLEDADPDICCLCAYGDTRLEHAEACLEAGAHLFMEKPVGFNAEEARRFKYLDRKFSEQKAAVAYTLRYSHEWMALRAVINSGAIGEVYSAQITYLHGHDFSQKSHRGLNLSDRGGNYIASSQLVHSTHPWDMARYLLGEVSEVFYASGRTPMAFLWMRSGALCCVVSGVQPKSGPTSNTHRYAVIHGTGGTAWLMKDMKEPHELHVYYRTDGETREKEAVTDLPPSSHGSILRTTNFLDAIEGKDELICSMYDGALTTDLLHSLWVSKRTQNRVPVFEEDHSG